MSAAVERRAKQPCTLETPARPAGFFFAMHSLSPASRARRTAAVVSWFTSQWRAGPKVSIAPTARHLPFNAPDDARGLHWRGEVHVVACQPADSLAQTMVHEAVGHYGLRALLGAEWPHFMRHIRLGLQAGDPGLRKIQQHVQHAYVDDAGQYCLSHQQEADEIAAYVAEEILCMRTGEIRPARPWTQALEAVRGRILREGLCLERAVTRSELEGMLLLAAKHLEGGALAPVWQWIGWAREWCGSMSPMPYKHRPPTDLQESQDLIKAANDADAAKLGGKVAFGEFLTLATVVGMFAAAALAVWLLSLMVGATAACVIGFFAIIIWLMSKE
ncbi:hypothetical protein [Delftia acidovorans]|uniref:hypothetical protein n=1 Tax=Delftia acidovorans TaxID=80866 RepID=UPI00286F1464|nr:hypothetical protein [Delftia acidovorans]